MTSVVVGKMMIFFVLNFLLFSVAWVIAQHKTRYDLVDIIWGFSFIYLAGINLLFLWPNVSSGSIIIFICIFIWGSRLTWFLGRRFFLKNEMDARYIDMIEGWKSNLVFNSYIKIFLFQCLVSTVLCYPILFAGQQTRDGLNFFDLFGLCLWSIGFILEVIADHQKYQFKKTEKKMPCNIGLWKYSRHPNYLGEIILWYGVGFMLVSQTNIFIAFLTPVLLHTIIYFVSGVALLEKKYKNNPNYKKYLTQSNKLLFKMSNRELK